MRTGWTGRTGCSDLKGTTLVAVAVAAGSLALTGCQKVEGKVDAPARPVKVHSVVPAAQESCIRYSATIRADEEVAVAFKSAGYIETVAGRRGADGRLHTLQPGDFVQAGETIARIRDAEYREHVNRSAGSVREAEAALAKARLDLERARGLFAAQSLTRPDLDTAESAFESGEARLASARAQLSLSEISLRDCALVAPMSGVVLERRVEAGVLAGTGTIGFVIGRVAQVKAVFGVPDLLVHRITRGTELDVATEAFADARFRGRVTAISPAADQQSRVFNVEVTLPNNDGRLKPGMIGRVEIVAGSTASPENGAVEVPLVAVVQAGKSEQGYAVFVVEGAADPVARRRPVVLGDVRGNAVAVTRGLQPGERIVISGASMLVDGETVHVISQ